MSLTGIPIRQRFGSVRQLMQKNSEGRIVLFFLGGLFLPFALAGTLLFFQEQPESVGREVFTSPDFGFQIEYPGNWYAEGLEEGVVFSSRERPRQAEDRGEFVVRLSVLPSSLSGQELGDLVKSLEGQRGYVVRRIPVASYEMYRIRSALAIDWYVFDPANGAALFQMEGRVVNFPDPRDFASSERILDSIAPTFRTL